MFGFFVRVLPQTMALTPMNGISALQIIFLLKKQKNNL